MKIEFIKKHIAGIKEGHIAEVSDVHAKRFIAEGFAVEFVAKKGGEKPSKKGKKKVK